MCRRWDNLKVQKVWSQAHKRNVVYVGIVLPHFSSRSQCSSVNLFREVKMTHTKSPYETPTPGKPPSHQLYVRHDTSYQNSVMEFGSPPVSPEPYKCVCRWDTGSHSRENRLIQLNWHFDPLLNTKTSGWLLLVSLWLCLCWRWLSSLWLKVR